MYNEVNSTSLNMIGQVFIIDENLLTIIHIIVLFVAGAPSAVIVVIAIVMFITCAFSLRNWVGGVHFLPLFQHGHVSCLTIMITFNCTQTYTLTITASLRRGWLILLLMMPLLGSWLSWFFHHKFSYTLTFNNKCFVVFLKYLLLVSSLLFWT